MRIATWNLENLFQPGDSSGPASQQAYEDKLAALARVIDALRPDVLAVQEVGEAEALEDLAEQAQGSWNLAVSDLPDGRGIRVGFMARPAVEEIESAQTFPSPLAPVQIDDAGASAAGSGRGALRIRVAAAGRAVDVVTCHLKSKLLTFPGGRFNPRDEGERARFGAYALYRRTGEAVTIRAFANRLLDGAGRDRALVVLGDLNDEPEAATTQILLGPPGSEIGTDGFDRPDQGDACRLWNLALRIPAERRFTRMFRTRPELIDHILVSHALVQRVTSVDTTADPPPSITEIPTERRDEPGSDHRPVIAEFDLS